MPSVQSSDRGDLEAAIGTGEIKKIYLTATEWVVVYLAIEQTKAGTRTWKPAELNAMVRENTVAKKNPAAVICALTRKGAFGCDAARTRGGKRFVHMLGVKYYVGGNQVFPVPNTADAIECVSQAEPQRFATLEELQADRELVQLQIDDAGRPLVEWETERQELSAIVNQHREELARAEQMLASHTKAKPVSPDTSALVQRQQDLDHAISHYESLRSVLAR